MAALEDKADVPEVVFEPAGDTLTERDATLPTRGEKLRSAFATRPAMLNYAEAIAGGPTRRGYLRFPSV